MASSITLADHIRLLRDDDTLSKKQILEMYGKMGDSIANTLCEAMLSEDTCTIYYNISPKQVQLRSRTKKGLDPHRPSSYTLHIDAEEDTCLVRDMNTPYTRATFREWDAPFLQMLFDTEKVDDVNSWSPEMLLMRYIGDTYSRTGRKKPKSATWMEEWATRKSTRKLFNKKVSILWESLPRIVAYVQNNSSYVAFERKLASAARMLCDTDTKERYQMFKRKSGLRDFFDALKTRMHLPMLYGRYVISAMAAARYTKTDIMNAIQNPTKACKPLREMLVFYWFQLLSPYDAEFVGEE
jgi:hypothetical protein